MEIACAKKMGIARIARMDLSGIAANFHKESNSETPKTYPPVPSRDLTYPLPAGTFQSMMFHSP